jgi:hypothetical protein
MKIFFASLMLLVLVTATASADGIVCVDSISTNGSWKGNDTGATPASVFTVQIDDLLSQTISANSCGVFTNLNVNENHIMKIMMNGKPYASFRFSFKDKGSDHLRLWYNEFYGTWQLWQPGRNHKCEYLKKNQAQKEFNQVLEATSQGSEPQH